MSTCPKCCATSQAQDDMHPRRTRNFRDTALNLVAGGWMLAELVPARLLDLHVVVPCGFLDIRKGEFSIGIRDVLHLIESCQRVSDVRSVGKRFLALLREGIHSVR